MGVLESTSIGLWEFEIPHNRLGISLRLEDLPYGAIFRHGRFTYVKGRVHYHQKYGKCYEIFPTPIQAKHHSLCPSYYASCDRIVEYIYHPCSSVKKLKEPLLFE